MNNFTTESKAPESPISAAISGLDSSSNRLRNLIGTLEERLDTILTPEAPAMPTSGEMVQQVHQSTLHRQLLNEVSACDLIADRVGSILRRLTV